MGFRIENFSQVSLRSWLRLCLYIDNKPRRFLKFFNLPILVNIFDIQSKSTFFTPCFLSIGCFVAKYVQTSFYL